VKNWYKYLIYLSVVFALVYLIKADFLVIPQIYSIQRLIWCALFLFLGFICDGLAWGAILRTSGFQKVSLKNALASHGTAIFGKYIPGKLWTIIGRAGYIAKRYDLSEKNLGIISLEAQFISIWTGFLFSSILLFDLQLSEFRYIVIIAAVIWLLLSMFLFTDFFHNIFSLLYEKILKRKVLTNHINIKVMLSVVPYYIMMWLFWCLSFYFLVTSVSTNPMPVLSGFSFAFAVNIGFIVIIAPGGIGIRESLLVGILMLYGIQITDATTISVVSRLWFFIGELFVFITAIIISFFKK
jgi:glycosyltransferase 2 family protein